MLQDSNATVTNFFSSYGFRGFLHENENDLFSRLHILDCGYAVTCMYRKLNEGVSPYGGNRCRLPISAGRALCVAFQSLYYLADDPKTCPEDLEAEVHAFVRHCLCNDHADCVESTHRLAERLLLVVERWQCRRIFMDEPEGPPSTPPEERAGASRLSQFFLRAPNQSPRPRPRFNNRFIDLELDPDCWGIPHERPSPVADHARRPPSSSLHSSSQPDNCPTSGVQSIPIEFTQCATSSLSAIQGPC